jgi:hypothetical protein
MTQTYSQELSRSGIDSLYTKFLQLAAPELLPQTAQLKDLKFEDRKCGFGLISQIKLNFNYFTLEQQNILKPLLQRKVKQTSMVSPSGFFRIHYDTTGSQTPIYDPSLTANENAYQVALAADSAYRFEVNFLTFPPPPSDNGEGGDDRYDIYITTADGNYGFTQPETALGNDKWTSYMEIHYSFQGSGFATHGLGAMRVTVAHEFHHSIQMGNYILRWEDSFFYELTSTSMEEFVFNTVNDYYAYMHSYFNSTDKSFSDPSHSGYDMAIWNIYIVNYYGHILNNYGFEIIKRQWELIPTQRAMIAIGNSLLEINSNFTHDYNRFGIWTFFTGPRTVQGKYFEEAVNYPLVRPLSKISYPQYPYADVNAEATSNNFIQFGNTTNGDTLYAIVTNGDISSVISYPTQTFQFKYTLFSDTLSGNRKLGDNYSARFEVTNPVWWSVSEILNGILLREDATIIPINEASGSFAFPNPFRYNGNVSISFDGKQGEDVDFNVYSSDMILVYSHPKSAASLFNNTIGISWDGFDKDGNKLASGVYIYVIKKGDNVVKGKVVIFNE